MGLQDRLLPMWLHEPILIRTVELRDVVDYFGYSDGYCDHKEQKKLFHSPIPALKKRIVESLGGTYQPQGSNNAKT
jgi:hypothetical protein